MDNNEQLQNKPEFINKNMILINDNIRKDIYLSLTIFSQINNFQHNYINNLFNDKSENS